ncbi:hypothetical protein [Novosphingobium guangzhouense]|uniref:Uncharacterized protein n=1 Tax=Novosphingobium guangzhouense TaxID=1850347 RepID=A0A2K2G5Z9_9SPHN|nr:hypothetical protein [Novosphingobium guangzhouense]PNU06460.1 hypothetical protein A8V01_02645 [Novosphingobium guangzhouense]
MDPKTFTDLAALPWTTQLVLASGYCGYLIAYLGIRYNHKATDTIFASLAFGLVALLVLTLPWQIAGWIRGSTAFFASIGAGIFWRAVIRSGLRRLAARANYSWSDDTPNAWDRLFEVTDHGPTQLTVELDDGRYLYCSNAARVGHLPFGPYVLGTTGDILMYVDRTTTAKGEDREALGTFSDDWGAMVTYIPKDRVRKIAVRLNPINPRAEEEAGWKARARAWVGNLRHPRSHEE